MENSNPDAIIEEETAPPSNDWPTYNENAVPLQQNVPGCILYDPQTNQYTNLQPFTQSKKVIEDEFIDMKFLKPFITTSLREDGGVIKYTDPNPVVNNEVPKPEDEKGEEEENEETNLPPENGARVRIRYEGRKEDGELLDKSRDRKQLKAFKLYNDTMISGIHYAVGSLKKGETGWFRFTPDYHYGPKGAPPIVPENAILFYKVELVDFTNPKKQLEVDDYDGRIDILNDSKEKGNEAYAKQEYDRAFKEYKRGSEIVKNFPKVLYSTLNDDQKEILRDFQLKLANNAVLACIKRKAYKEGLYYADVALGVDPKNAKATFRKGQCLMDMDYLEAAIKCFKDCIELEGGSKECERLIEVCLKRKETRLHNEKKRYKQVWEKMAEVGEEEEQERKKREKMERKKAREQATMKEEIPAPNPSNTVTVNQLLEGAIINTESEVRPKVDVS